MCSQEDNRSLTWDASVCLMKWNVKSGSPRERSIVLVGISPLMLPGATAYDSISQVLLQILTLAGYLLLPVTSTSSREREMGSQDALAFEPCLFLSKQRPALWCLWEPVARLRQACFSWLSCKKSDGRQNCLCFSVVQQTLMFMKSQSTTRPGVRGLDGDESSGSCTLLWEPLICKTGLVLITSSYWTVELKLQSYCRRLLCQFCYFSEVKTGRCLILTGNFPPTKTNSQTHFYSLWKWHTVFASLQTLDNNWYCWMDVHSCTYLSIL